MRLLTLIICLIPISGCLSINTEFISVVKDHRIMTIETNDAIISTLEDECKFETDSIKLEVCNDLIERLRIISRQSVAIEKYIMHEVTEKDLALYLRSKWEACP